MTEPLQRQSACRKVVGDERRVHSAIYRSGSAHPDGEVSQLVDDQNCSGDVFGIDLRGRFETGAKSRAATRHHCIGVYAAAKKRVRIRPAPILPANVRCSLPCEVCRDRYGHSSSACRASARALNFWSLDRAIQLPILRVASQWFSRS